MKRLTISIVLILTIIALAGLALWDLGQGVEELHVALDGLRQTPVDQQQALVDQSQHLMELWQQKENRFVLYVNHGTLDHITQMVAELPALAQYGEFSHLYSKVDSIGALLDDLWQSSIPSYKTLL